MSAAPVIPIESGQELEVRALSIPEQAKTIHIVDQASYENACRFLTDVIVPMRREVDDTFDPICKKAYASYREANDQRNRHEKPLDEAERLVKQEIGCYELRRRKEQEELERLAREAQELETWEAAEIAAVEAEAQGATVEEVKAIFEQPVALPKPAVAPTIQRISGITTRKTYKAECVDIKALCRAVADGKVSGVVTANQSALNAMARAQGPDLMRFLPGVRVYEEGSVATRRK